MPSTDVPPPQTAPSSDVPSSGASTVELKITHEEVVSFARQQAGIPLLHRLELTHRGTAPLRGAVIRILPEPGFADPKEVRLADLEAGAELVLGDLELDLTLSPAYLSSQRERVAGRLLVRVEAGGGVLAEQSLPLAVLAYNEWSGLGSLPEILAAFVTPNLPSIQGLLNAVAAHLRAATGNPSLDAYQQDDRARVLRMVEATFLALRGLELTYATPPASFEAGSQKIRFPDEVLATRFGTCLDLALLSCAVLEQSGLHPLLILERGHAYAGCWLQPETLEEPVGDDPQQLRKRFDEGQLTVFETTLAVSGSSATFAAAEAAAKARLSKKKDFRFAIDIRRARANRIHPLPVRVEDGHIVVVPPPQPAELPGTTGVDAGRRLAPLAPAHAPEVLPKDRVQYWGNQLLDLSLRNRLLNFGRGKCVQVRSHALGVLEDKLAANEEFQLLASPASDPRSVALHDARHGEDLEARQLEADLQARKIRLLCAPEEVEATLLGLSRDARLALEEGGANTLFLALGVLEWRETPGSSRTCKAPILLMPVTLARKSVRSGFRLKRLDEETRINVTLLEKLQRDFQITVEGLNPLPEDEFGVNVAAVLQCFRRAVRDVKGFEVREDAWLGLFQFTKFLLWKDLTDRTETLKKSPVVRHLIETPREPFQNPTSAADPRRLDVELPPSRNFCILEADSSQLAAIMSAASGLSFVMIGPPGTGKSQTIANTIAFLIAMGRTVLFVAEKRAALEVVQKRLERAGLGPFCLELHSNKTGKTEVFEQLRKAVDYVGHKEPEEWARDTRELERQRQRLNDTVASLHRRLPNGYSAYRCHGVLLDAAQARPRLAFRAIAEHDSARLALMRDVVQELVLRMRDFPDFAGHPLAPVRHIHWTPDWEDGALAALDAAKSAAEALVPQLAAMLDTLRLQLPRPTLARLETLRALVLHLPELPNVPVLSMRSRMADITQAVDHAMQCVRVHRSAVSVLQGWKTDALLNLEIESTRQQWNAATQAFVLVRPFRKKKVLRALAEYRTDASLPDPENLEPFFERAARLQKSARTLRDAGAAVEPLIGRALWNGGQPDDAAVSSAVKWLARYHELINTLAGTDLLLLKELRAAVVGLAEAGIDLQSPGSAFRAAITNFDARLRAFQEAWQKVVDLLVLDQGDWAGAEMPTAGIALRERVHAGARDLQAWCHYMGLRHEATRLELQPLLAMVDGGAPPAELPEAFELAYAEASLRQLLQQEEVLRSFFGDAQEERIQKFRALDKSLLALASKVVSAAVSARRPATRFEGNKPVGFGEIGILNNELTKRSRHRPIRQLISEVPNILPKFKPCLLMSPLSVAQYLDASQQPFDVVVFDEASQIPVADAIGAMARGAQVIVAGDPRQLPPTSFFQRGASEPDEDAPAPGSPEEIVANAESILDECMAAQMPVVHLRWHYRSRHESLIAFSNHHYYDDHLLTHPEPFAEERGVRWHPVEGVYDRSGSATNRREAEAVIAAVAAHYKDPALRELSLGVVTFNSKQQQLIEDLLEDARRGDAELDELLATERDEPLFVKNLENVQGDERDVIIFSVTYGRDTSGRVYQNFGPLNQVGGERRLNVAVTRARRQIHVYSTLRPEQIDLTRTRALGVRQLKNYLEYAARGPESLPARQIRDGNEDPAAAFEFKVAGALRAQGWEVHERVGCSSYRVDMAVVHPEHPEHYVIGIECDGPGYFDAPTARDRDLLRRQILEGLGWRVHRIWSTDWYRNPARERERLVAVVAGALANFKVDAPPPPLPEPQPVPARAEPPPPAAPTPASPPAPKAEPPPSPPAPASPAQLLQGAAGRGGVPYQVFRNTGLRLDKLDPYAASSKKELRSISLAIVRVEGPISHSLLATRMAALLGMGRTSAKFQERLATLIPETLEREVGDAGTFYWPPNVNAASYTAFRTHETGSDERRALGDICAREQANAMLHLIRTYKHIPFDDLLRQTCLLFGYQSLTNSARDALRPGLEAIAKQSGVIRQEDGYLWRDTGSPPAG